MARRTLRVFIAVCALTLCTSALPRSKGFVDRLVDSVHARESYNIPATGTLEVAFSPNEGSENLVIKAIDSAKSDIKPAYWRVD